MPKEAEWSKRLRKTVKDLNDAIELAKVVKKDLEEAIASVTLRLTKSDGPEDGKRR